MCRVTEINYIQCALAKFFFILLLCDYVIDYSVIIRCRMRASVLCRPLIRMRILYGRIVRMLAVTPLRNVCVCVCVCP